MIHSDGKVIDRNAFVSPVRLFSKSDKALITIEFCGIHSSPPDDAPYNKLVNLFWMY
ncbi:MAG TPA: hypothetical protein VN703_01475 [Candidatus Sulfopaludibacter sp.]|nr:hypothetical protein [Candidatus Sulfopaludibacter sp.]